MFRGSETSNRISTGPPSAVESEFVCESRGRWPHTFVEMYHEIISRVVLPFLLIQEGQMSVSGESMCTKYWLTA